MHALIAKHLGALEDHAQRMAAELLREEQQVPDVDKTVRRKKKRKGKDRRRGEPTELAAKAGAISDACSASDTDASEEVRFPPRTLPLCMQRARRLTGSGGTPPYAG